MKYKYPRIDLKVKEMTMIELGIEIAHLPKCGCKQTLCPYCAVNREIKLRKNFIKAEKVWGKDAAKKFFGK